MQSAGERKSSVKIQLEKYFAKNFFRNQHLHDKRNDKIKTDLTILVHVSITIHHATNSFAFFLSFFLFLIRISYIEYVLFYNIPSFSFFSSSFYLFLTDFFFFLPFLETKQRSNKRIKTFQLYSFQDTSMTMANVFPSLYLYVSE